MPDGAIALAVGAGMLAAVNPCGFALLPAYLSLLVLDERPTRTQAVARAVKMTVAMTLGFAVVFVIFGMVIAPAASSVQRYLPWFTTVLGVVLVGGGGWLLTGRDLPGLRLKGGSKTALNGSVGSMFGFGISYATASLTCTIAPFLAVVVTAFRAGTVAEGMGLFLLYAAGMGLVVGTAAIAVALAQHSLVGRIRRLGRLVPRASGILLAVTGGYVAYYGWWEIRVLNGANAEDPVIELAQNIQQPLASGVGAVGVTGFAVGLGLLGLLAGTLIRKTMRKEAGNTMSVQATWNGAVVAESDDTIVVEGNHYFPEDSLRREFFSASRTHSVCPWKGVASYYSLTVDGVTNPDAAWQYKKPLPFARKVKNRVAFWNGVQIKTDDSTREGQVQR